MKQTTGDRKNKNSLMILIALSLLIALGSSFYLTDLYLRVHSPHAVQIESFCAISEGVNCVSVANSKYADVFGIPVSLYGLEYYLLGLFVLTMAALGLKGFSRWDSLIFWMGLGTIPVTLTLLFISTVMIKSFCIMCCVLYMMNFSLILFPALFNRGRIGTLFTKGPRNLFRGLIESKATLAAVAFILAIALTQFFWVPGLLNINSGSDMAKGSWKGLEVNGLALGDPESPVKIEEFTDFQCPFCAKAHFVIMQLIEKYPGQIYHVHRDMPLDQACNPYLNRPFHPDACNAAMVSRCASMQGKFREMEELLFSNRHDLKKDDLVKYVQEIGLDSDQYNACLQNPETMEAIVKDIQEAKKRGVTGTPAFFVNGEAIKGFKPIEFWEQKVTEILKKEK